MDSSQLNWITGYIWGIADDVLRDLYVRGKYRDVILPMTVLRRLDAVLEPTKQAVLDMKANLDKAGVTNQDAALRQASGQAFYNTSKFTLRDLRALVTRSSDGQMLFLANMCAKMKHDTPLGSRIAEVHNGSSLFTGDAGQGESNIRRWIIENDWLEAIVALPLNMFYNTGIATYIWVVTNRKPEHRQGKVQLIDATKWFKPLRKNMGMKNCELSEDDIHRICDSFLDFEETEESKVFPNEAFGYWKVTVERPLRLSVELTSESCKRFRAACKDAKESDVADLIDRVAKSLGAGPHLNFNIFMDAVEADAKKHSLKLTAKRKKLIQNELARRDENAEPVVKKVHKKGKAEADPIRGRFPNPVGDQSLVLEYEPDSDLRDTEQVPLLEDGGIEAFIRREVLPHAEDAWFDETSIKVGYEISFNRYF